MLARFNQGHLGELLKGGAIALLLKLAAALLAFVVSIAAARLLGAESAGYYFFSGIDCLGTSHDGPCWLRSSSNP